MDFYAEKAKNSLINARTEIRNILNLLDDSININNEPYQENEIKKISDNLNVQINNLTYYIIPAIKKL